jgi:threonine/homoserine/homoserine lactone efflux protein
MRRPLTTGEAVLFQFANPKAWMMAVTAAAAFLPGLLPLAANIGDQIRVTLAMAFASCW